MTRCSFCKANLIEYKLCAKCKKASYCNKQCQINHWKASHKSSCCAPPFHSFVSYDKKSNHSLEAHECASSEAAYDKKSNHSLEARECANCGSAKSPFFLCSKCKLVNYCSDACQKQHWKAVGGHKKFCVSEKERMPLKTMISERKSELNSPQSIKCAICLEVVTCSTTCLLPCAHIFHIRCIKELRIMGVVQACPICRTQLPHKDLSHDANQRAVYLNNMNKQHPFPLAQWKVVDETITMLRIAADLGCPDACRNLSVILNAVGDFTGAEAAYRKALEIEPTFIEAWISLGKVRESKGELLGALLCYRNALKINPRKTLALYNSGVVLKDMGDLAGSVAAYRFALEVNPMYADASRNLAIVLYEMGDLSGAETAYRRTLEIDPQYDAHFGLGNVLLEKRDYAGAEAAFRAALDNDPIHSKALWVLCSLLRSKGDYAGADIAYRKALEIDPMMANASFRPIRE